MSSFPGAADSRPTYEALASENVALRTEVAEQAEAIEGLMAQVAGLTATVTGLTATVVELKARLAMNSRNSSKPPSSDGYAKPAPKSRRARSGKKPGKQPGGPGRHLAQLEDPDATRTHVPERCGGCGADLGDAVVVGAARRQVFDLPPVALFCTEHRAERRRCACGSETTAPFPPDATAPTCYGPALRAYVCYLVTRQHIPIARVAELLRDAYGASVSTGTIVAMVEEGAAMLEEFLVHVKDRLARSDVVHADETGLRVNAALAWVHSASTTGLTLYHLDDKRGTAAMDAMGVIEHLTGVLVHDGWAPYRNYTDVDHALCNAHHLRELDAAAGTDGQPWAADMAGLLCDAYQQVLGAKTDGHSALTADELGRIRADYRAIIAAGHEANPAPAPTGKRGRPKRTKAANLLLRLDVHADDILRFSTDFRVPFDNNLSERDIRMVKVHQKVSGGFRSTGGAEAFLALRSYLSTAAKHGVNLLDVLQRLFDANPWMPVTPGPGP
ncbi:IS66 family transposase [Actinokineospora sp.]|uniref:IS66 family transposase n=1 Tax=Actinokineospora sp. TaxID=1872133 RepID=UPI003D6BF5B3